LLLKIAALLVQKNESPELQGLFSLNLSVMLWFKKKRARFLITIITYAGFLRKEKCAEHI